PKLAQTQVEPAIVVVLGLNGGGGGKFTIGSKGRRAPIINCLVGEPGFAFEQPAAPKVMIITKGHVVTVDPVVVISSRGEIWILIELLNRNSTGICDRNMIGVKVDGEELGRVRPITNIDIALVEVRFSVIALTIRMDIAKVSPEFQRSLSSLENVES